MVRSRSSVSCLGTCAVPCESSDTTAPAIGQVTCAIVTSQPKPKLVKQKQSLCEEEIEDEGGDEPTDMRDLVNRLPDFKVSFFFEI